MDARITGDIRMVAAGLAANEAVVRPGLITATGRAAPSQYATVPVQMPAKFALLPFADYDDAPDHRPGGGLVGGRISSIAPFLRPGAITAADDLRVVLRAMPASREDIRERLRGDAGLHWAPGAFFSLAAWEDERVYVMLDHLRLNGTASRLVIAHAQAMLALRRMWLLVVWQVDALPASPIPDLLPSLSEQCGAVAVGRAMIDVADVLLRLVGDAQAERSDAAAGAASAVPLQRISTLLNEYVVLVAAAEGKPEAYARQKLAKAVKTARRMLDAVAVFSVAAEKLEQRWERLDALLIATPRDPDVRLSSAVLAEFDAQLVALPGAALGTRLERTVWPNYVRRSLLRLSSPDVTIRHAGLDRIRADLLYAMLVTRRLDRPYALFPWLAAPHYAFLHCAGGALGALATLLECGRRMEVARGLKHQVDDVPVEGSRQPPATAERLTIPAARAIWSSRYLMTVAVDRGYAAGRALEQNAISHATISAGMAGTYFCPAYAITSLRFGRLGWSQSAAMRDRRTVAAVQRIEQARPVMRLVTRHDDLPRHLGMTIKRLVGETIVSVLPDHDKRKAGKLHRQRAADAAQAASRRDDPAAAADAANRTFHEAGQPLYQATLHMARSMLLTLDCAPATDPEPRDALYDQTVELPLAGIEMDRVAKRQAKATRRSVRDAEMDQGQNLRRVATTEPTVSDARGALLRALAKDVARWREPAKKKQDNTPCNPKPDGRSRPPRYDGPPRDDLLHAILRGRHSLDGLAPVGSLALPLLWLAPLIDRYRVSWIANGAPLAYAPAGPAAQAQAISAEIAQVHGWASLLYTRSLPTRVSVTAACHLFTGHSTITADPSHAG